MYLIIILDEVSGMRFHIPIDEGNLQVRIKCKPGFINFIKEMQKLRNKNKWMKEQLEFVIQQKDQLREIINLQEDMLKDKVKTRYS